LEQIEDTAMNLFRSARVECDGVLSAERELLVARIDYAQTREEKIKACDEAIQKAVECQSLAEALKNSARGHQIDVLRAQAFELEARIAREKAEAGT
jgi:hypothetical protein